MLAAIELAEQCAGINGFLIDTAGMNPRPAVVCADGFEFFVRAGNIAFCSPQDDNALAYETCEVRFPSEAEALFLPYIDFEDEDPTDTMYPYVPVEAIDRVIKKHGGFKN